MASFLLFFFLQQRLVFYYILGVTLLTILLQWCIAFYCVFGVAPLSFFLQLQIAFQFFVSSNDSYFSLHHWNDAVFFLALTDSFPLLPWSDAAPIAYSFSLRMLGVALLIILLQWCISFSLSWSDSSILQWRIFCIAHLWNDAAFLFTDSFPLLPRMLLQSRISFQYILEGTLLIILLQMRKAFNCYLERLFSTFPLMTHISFA